MTDQPAALRLYEEAMAFAVPAALRAAVTLGLADRLAGGPRTAGEVAAEVGADPAAVHRILRLLATREVVEEDGQGHYHLTGVGQALRPGVPGSAVNGILMLTDPLFWTSSHELAAGVANRRSSTEQVLGVSLVDYFARHPAKEALFFDGIEEVSGAENPIVAGCYDFPPTGTVADVGGRFGGFLLALLRRHPGLRGILVDQAHILRHHKLDVPDLAGRWQVVEADYYRAVPAADVYVIKRALHVLADEQCVQVLRTCRRAMPATGRVLVVDAVVPPGNRPHPSKAMDLLMLSLRSGRERTRAELEPLFSAAGLRLSRLVPTPSPMSIAEGVAS